MLAPDRPAATPPVPSLRLIDAVVLAGTIDHCLERLASLVAAGLTHVDLAPLPVADRDLAAAAMVLIEHLSTP